MPTINIPPILRFVLYLIGSLSLLTVSYAVDKEWAGDAEVRYVTGLAGLLFILAAAKTGLSDNSARLTGTVVSETGETGVISASLTAPDSPTPPAPAPAESARETRRNPEDGDPHR